MKRIISLFLIIPLILLSTAACGKKVANNNNKTKAATSKNAAEETVTGDAIAKEPDTEISVTPPDEEDVTDVAPVTPCEDKQIFDLTDSKVAEALNAYYSVLTDQSEYFFVGGYASTDRYTTPEAQTYTNGLLAAQNDTGLPIKKFAVLDLDNDGLPEVILPLTKSDGFDEFFYILYYRDGHVYCLLRSQKQFFDIKCDGTFEHSGSVLWGFATVSFKEDDEGRPCTYNTFTSREVSRLTDPETGELLIDPDTDRQIVLTEFIVNNQTATEEEFNMAYEEQTHKPDVTWHDVSDAEIMRYFLP